MKKGTEKLVKNTFYKTNPRGGISLIVLVITIIVVIILAAAVIISLQNNNPMVEANKARINSDVANMQAIFTNAVGKVMAEKQDVVQVVGGQLYATPTGNKKTVGEATYQILGTDGTPVVEGKIIFGTGDKTDTVYYTGKELPLYSSDTKWSVDNQGLLSVEVGGVTYGEGTKSENPPVVEEGKIAESDNPMLQSWNNYSRTDFHDNNYRGKIKKVKFNTADEVPNSKIESWDVSEAKDKSVMAWIEDDGNNSYVLTIAGKDKIVANPNSSFIFYDFNEVTQIENFNLLDTSRVTSFRHIFSGCRNLTYINFSGINTSSLINVEQMFYNCDNLVSIDLSDIDTSNVENMNSMFHECDKLENVNLGNKFSTNEVTSMTYMFSDCSSLKELDLSNFNTSKVTNMCAMFSHCSSITNLDLSNFDMSKVTDYSSMFAGCNNLIDLNLGNNIIDGYRVYSVFSSCNKLNATITLGKCSNFDDMFRNAATEAGAKIIVNYTEGASSLVNSMIATKSATSNVVKGVQI